MTGWYVAIQTLLPLQPLHARDICLGRRFSSSSGALLALSLAGHLPAGVLLPRMPLATSQALVS